MYHSKKVTVKIETSRIIKPSYESIPPNTNDYIHLTPFDTVTYDSHIAIIYAYRPPTPMNSTLLNGLMKALGVFREWAGRLSYDKNGKPVVLLNDAGVTFVEASVEAHLDQLMPLKPSKFLLSFHPDINGIEELLQVQVTRFTCGSMVIGFTAHHSVADGHASSNFLVAWGQACKGLDIDPLPIRDRTLFKPREPPLIEFEHRGVEFMSPKYQENNSPEDDDDDDDILDNIKVEQVHFSLGFLAKLKSNASLVNLNKKPFSTFESLVAHLWRTITMARGLSLYETTNVKISINGRMRLIPRVPDEYFGNLVLWAYPTSKVNDLIQEPLSYATKLIHDTVAEVNDGYFKSFIDFESENVKEQNLVSTADMNKLIELPNIEVTSWLRFPFYDLDFGGGSPYIFMPSYCSSEGSVFLLPSFIGDGSIDCFISLFEDHLASFKKICYELD